MEPSFNRYSYGFHPSFGFPRIPYRYKHRQYVHNDRYEKSMIKLESETNSKESEVNSSRVFTDSRNPVFEIFGIKLFFDDILLISLIFFLYNEGIHDQYLFIALILLLLS